MSKRPPFEPIGFVKRLEKSGDFCSDNKVVYRWTGTHWEAMDNASVDRMASDWLIGSMRFVVNAANARSARETALICLPKISKPSTDTVIPLRNGYLHLDTAPTLKPHDKALALRHTLSCEYDLVAAPPGLFMAFLERCLPCAHVRDRVQEYIGYTLLADARFQRAQIWLGAGANGKGTLANVVQALHEKTAAVQLDHLDGFRLANMVGASLIYCDEAPQRNINEQIIKSLIAGELVQIDRKYMDPISVNITGKWLILANHLPALTDQSPGFWRRLDIIPFDVEIPERERDATLAKRIIDSELSGVLNWAVEGLMRLLARGRFDDAMPAAVRNAVDMAKAETDSVHAWAIDLGIRLKTTTDTPKANVYANYSRWCKDNGMSTIPSTKFWKRLSSVVGQHTDARKTSPNGEYLRTCNVHLP